MGSLNLMTRIKCAWKPRIFLHLFKFIVSYTIYTIFIIFFKTSKNTIIQPLITKRISLENKKSIQNFCIKFINRYSISILFACKFRKTRNLLPTNSIINEMNYSYLVSSFPRDNNCIFLIVTLYRINIACIIFYNRDFRALR